MSEPGTAVATVQAQAPARAPLPFEASDFDGLYRMSQALCRSNLLPDALRGKPEDVVIILMQGRELGLQPMQSLRGIDVIKGKAQVSPALMAAMVQSHPACEYLTLVESTPTRAVYETKRRGSPAPVRMPYTIEDAQRAGLATKDNYRTQAGTMLRWRSLGAICRAVYQDIVFGLYVKGEILGSDEPGEVDAQEAPSARVIDGTPQPPRKPTTIADLVEQAKNEKPAAAQPEPEPPPQESNGGAPPEEKPASTSSTSSSSGMPDPSGERAPSNPSAVTGTQELAALVREAREIEGQNADAFDAICAEHGVQPTSLRTAGLEKLRNLLVDLRPLRKPTQKALGT